MKPIKDEYDIDEVLANWKWNQEHKERMPMDKGGYHRLPLTQAELEEIIREKLPEGGILAAYVKVTVRMQQKYINQCICQQVKALYRLSEGKPYFTIDEVDALMQMDYDNQIPKMEFVRICMDMIASCPLRWEKDETVHGTQELVLSLGTDEEVWRGYYNNLFPKFLLESLYAKMKWKHKEKMYRRAWIIAWMSL